ncbi:hypothetical protein N0V82_004083 [Gnomoniopsis sp. IMI 355080]|nr:hypothetical protein N0V82_004083 [Gnomoniopsis sp. IMI 355080]
MAQVSSHSGARSVPYQDRVADTSQPSSSNQEAGATRRAPMIAMGGPRFRYNTQGKDQEPSFVDSALHMALQVSQDKNFKTRLVCEAKTYLGIVDGAGQSQLVSTVNFSIFSGKPSKTFRFSDDKRMLSQWLGEWHHCSLRQEPYRSSAPDKEHVWAVRALYGVDGSPNRPDSKQQAGPRETDTLCYISKIVTEEAFAGKKLLSPMMDLLYRIVPHVHLADFCPITGPVCWVLEPGFIDTEENRNMWPKLNGEDEYDYFERVTQVLLEKVYPKIGFEVCRKDFKTGDRCHTYMCRRVYVHRQPGHWVASEIGALPNKY